MVWYWIRRSILRINVSLSNFWFAKGYMRRKKKLKIIKTYLLVGTLNLIRFFIKHFKSFAHKIYGNIDWKYYKKEQFKIDPKAEKWAKHNCWFGYDELMTNAAFKIHKELVEFEGVDPKSKKYYNEIDKRIYDKFKNKFKKYYSMDN